MFHVSQYYIVRLMSGTLNKGKTKQQNGGGRGRCGGGQEDKSQVWWDMPISYNFSIWELEVGASGVGGQPQLHSEFKAHNNKKKQ